MTEEAVDLPAELGEVIGGYTLIRVLGQGGMGCVFEGSHTRLGRKAAIKVLAKSLAHDGQFVSRFFHEAKVVNDVRHPNIVDIIDFVESDEPRRVAYVMEYIAGPPLNVLLRERRLSVRQAVNLALHVARALRPVHALGVVHRDLKPANILVAGDLEGDLAADGAVKILDFGVAKIQSGDGSHKTVTGAMLGTPAYMAPEQVAGDHVTTAADVYALGEILYEVLTGERAFSGDNLQIFRAKLGAAPPALVVPATVPEAAALSELIAKSTAVEPPARVQLAGFIAELEAIRRRLPAHSANLEPPAHRRMSVPSGVTASHAQPMLETVSLPRPRPVGLLVGVASVVTAAAILLLVASGAGPTVEALPSTPPPPTPRPAAEATGPAPAAVPTPAPAAIEPAPAAKEPPPAAKEPAPDRAAERPSAVRAPRPTATVEVRSEPSGAAVHDASDDVKLCAPTPCAVELVGGRRQVVVRLAGHEPAALALSSARAEVEVFLAAAPRPAAPPPKPAEDVGPLKKRDLPTW